MKKEIEENCITKFHSLNLFFLKGIEIFWRLSFRNSVQDWVFLLFTGPKTMFEIILHVTTLNFMTFIILKFYNFEFYQIWHLILLIHEWWTELLFYGDLLIVIVINCPKLLYGDPTVNQSNENAGSFLFFWFCNTFTSVFITNLFFPIQNEDVLINKSLI